MAKNEHGKGILVEGLLSALGGVDNGRLPSLLNSDMAFEIYTQQ
jgi:hypothetical protein